MIKILILFLLCFNHVFSQTLIKSDDMESTSTWRGSSTTGTYSSFVGGLSDLIDNPPSYKLYSSVDTCYQIRGTGLGSSVVERDTFLYPNVIIPTGRPYQIRFKLASFGLNPSVQTAAGVDQTDWIELQYTVNNGLSWWRDAQIQGFGNAMWSFDGAIGTNVKTIITRTGSMSTTTPTIYVTNFNGPITNVNVNLPVTNISQLRLRFITNINATGETFMIDDVEIWDMTVPLPVELIEFKGNYYNTGIKLFWSTASENNNDRFEILKSFDGINYFKLTTISGRGTTSFISNYDYIDYDVCDTIVYYKLKQIDYDGLSKEYDPIAFKCRNAHIYDDFFDVLGRKTKMDFDGIKIYQK
jgi:hypothetical protein